MPAPRCETSHVIELVNDRLEGPSEQQACSNPAQNKDGEYTNQKKLAPQVLMRSGEGVNPDVYEIRRNEQPV